MNGVRVRDFVALRNDQRLSIAMETVIAVIIPTAVTVVTVGNAEHALDRAHGAADTGADSASDHTAHRAGNAVAFMGAFLRTAHDALGMASLRQR